MAQRNAVILVEGESDRAAVLTLAGRLGRDFDTENVEIIVMGGASPLADHLGRLLVDQRYDGLVAGVIDVGETGDLEKGLDRVGLSRDGFFTMDPDLEGEMIRAVGPGVMEAIFEEEGELRGFRTMQNQPHWRGKPIEEQMHRFLRVKSHRNIRYGTLLAEAVDIARIPKPLRDLIDYV